MLPIVPEIVCVAAEEDLQKLSVQSNIKLAIEFENITRLMTNDPVEYYIRVSGDYLMLMSWTDFVDTYHQDPNSDTPISLAVLYTPIQQFIDQAITTFKTSKKMILSYSRRQFPNLEYFVVVGCLYFLSQLSYVELTRPPSHVCRICDFFPHGDYYKSVT